jgi:hypothetical protein
MPKSTIWESIYSGPRRGWDTFTWVQESKFDNLWIHYGQRPDHQDSVNWNYFSNIIMWDQTNHSVENIESRRRRQHGQLVSGHSDLLYFRHLRGKLVSFEGHGTCRA